MAENVPWGPSAGDPQFRGGRVVAGRGMLAAMCPPAARISDMHTCPMVNGVVPHVGGPIVKGQPNVLVGFLPAARIGDQLVCVGPPDVIMKGSPTVLIGNMPAARMGDNTAHGGVIVIGCPTVMIGESGGGGGGGGGGIGMGISSRPSASPLTEAFQNAAERGSALVCREDCAACGSA
jgi:uncharacterized Zn-binding protein involved in type VI secretion